MIGKQIRYSYFLTGGSVIVHSGSAEIEGLRCILNHLGRFNTELDVAILFSILGNSIAGKPLSQEEFDALLDKIGSRENGTLTVRVVNNADLPIYENYHHYIDTITVAQRVQDKYDRRLKEAHTAV